MGIQGRLNPVNSRMGIPGDPGCRQAGPLGYPVF